MRLRGVVILEIVVAIRRAEGGLGPTRSPDSIRARMRRRTISPSSESASQMLWNVKG